MLPLSQHVRDNGSMEQRSPTHLLCKRSPFAHSVDWPEAVRQVKISELAEYGSIGEDGSVERLMLTAAVHDAAMLTYPIQMHEIVGPIAIALLRDGLISRESMSHVQAYVDKNPRAEFDLWDARAVANWTVTQWAEDHVIHLNERVQASRSLFEGIDALGIEQRFDPLGLDRLDEVDSAKSAAESPDIDF